MLQTCEGGDIDASDSNNPGKQYPKECSLSNDTGYPPLSILYTFHW